mmetsp:Transcript_26954/g.40561  ORF Transcript_26954/g.40561 Transcript_26954/m.40561 type:complete len:282 (-) Transcript_26954:492-1337(-)
MHTKRMRPASLSASTMAVFLLLALPLLLTSTFAYPIITEVDESFTKCFNFNVPDDDDAHMVFIALPHEVDNDVEEWFNTKLNDMTRKGSNDFMKTLPEVSKEIHEKINDEDFNGRSNVYLKLTVPKRPVLRHQMFMWYAPVVVMNVVKASQRGQKNNKNVRPPGGYSVCFENKNADQRVKLIFDVVLTSDEGQEDELQNKIIKKEHLTPLESNFQEGIKAANTILNEMKYMEKREARMRHTAESTNSKIRLFSYVSVIVLLGVTWLQRTYLKSYFKKKKLM